MSDRTTVLVTGAGGFIGQHLVPYLAAQGYRVIAASRTAMTFDNPNIVGAQIPDLSEPFDWQPLLEECDAIVHLVGVAHTLAVDALHDHINHQVTVDLARVAHRRGTHLVFVSSIAAQSSSFSYHELTEGDLPTPSNAYGRSKLAAEQAIRAAGVSFTILRPVMVYGDGEKGHVASIHRVSRLPIPLPFGALTAKRSVLSVENFNSSVVTALTDPRARGETFIVSDPTPLTIPDFISRYRAGLGKSAWLIPIPERWLELFLSAIGQRAVWERIGLPLVARPRKLLALGWKPTAIRASGKVAIVSQHYAPDPSTAATYMTAIADGLSTEREVIVISGTVGSASVAPATAARPLVLEVRISAPNKTALVRRAMAAVMFSIRSFFAILKHANKGDVVLCVTNPFTLPYSVTLAAKLRGASMILLIYDLYPEVLVLAGLAKPTSLVTRAIRFANTHLFRALHTIITIGRDVEARLLAYSGVEKAKIKFIPNWVLLPIGYREVKRTNRFRSDFGGKFVVGLSGNLGFTHSAETVFEAARLLTDEPDIHMLLSGWGRGWTQLKELCAANPTENITLIEPVPESDLEEFLSAADIWIIPYRRNISGVSVPSRIYNLLAVGRPVIVTAEANSEAALMLKEENIGWVTRPEDPLDLAAAIRSAAADREETLAKGRRAAIVAQRYTYDRAIASYRQVMNEALQDRPGT